MAEIHGVAVVDKPPGLTSAQVVARVKRATRSPRVGHAGTLDPMATGVLPICMGEATKLAGFLLAADKAYTGELMLGRETDTLDAEGVVIREQPERAAEVTRADLVAAMATMVGAQQQVPPMFSAIKHGGRRLHQLARAGETVERAARAIEVASFDLTELALPRARFAVACSKGTYVRSLVADLGASLGCGAHLTALRRIRSGPFSIERAIELAEIEAASAIPATGLIGLADALGHLAAFPVPPDRVPDVGCGKRLAWTDLVAGPAPEGICRLLTPAGALLALVRVEPHGRLAYERVFPSALTNPG